MVTQLKQPISLYTKEQKLKRREAYKKIKERVAQIKAKYNITAKPKYNTTSKSIQHVTTIKPPAEVIKKSTIKKQSLIKPLKDITSPHIISSENIQSTFLKTSPKLPKNTASYIIDINKKLPEQPHKIQSIKAITLPDRSYNQLIVKPPQSQLQKFKSFEDRVSGFLREKI